jgi:hypothetical protein
MSNVCFGFKPSTIDGSETIFKGSDKIELPDSYTYKPYLPSVVDQGNMEICVPCTMAAYLNWRENLKEGVTKDNKISMNEIYSSRTNSGEGMTYKDAFKFLRHNGVNSKNGKLKIRRAIKKDKDYVIEDKTITIADLNDDEYDSLVLDFNSSATKVVLENGNPKRYYTIVRLKNSDTAGYRITDLVYPSDLIANIGESLTSILDKIKGMLGDFEYFYDVDGRFIF